MASTMFEDNFWAENGFDELRRLMKQGSDFVKEIMGVVQERADIEKQYSSKLVQLTKKIRRANGLSMGSHSEAWQKLGDAVESEAEIHKNLAQDLMSECHNPLKQFLEEKIRQRKPLENAVEKHKKTHLDKFSEQLKLKRTAHAKCRELEQTLDHLENIKSRRGSVTNEKEISKVEKNARKSEDSLVKADRDYKDSNIRTEEARLSWESSMYRCCRHLEGLERVRLEEVSSAISKYTQIMLTIVSPLQESCEELSEMAGLISPDRDIEGMCQNFGTGPNLPEQLMLDTFEEDLNNHMEAERRQSSLDKKIQDLEQDIDRKSKEKKGVMSLSAAYEKTPDFVDEQGAADVNRQLIEANALINMLKANHFKLLTVRSEISGLPAPASPYTEYIQVRKDRQNQSMSILSIPIDQVSILEEQTIASWTPPSPSISHTYSSVKKRDTLPQRQSQHEAAQYEEFDNEDVDQQQQDEGQDDITYICRCEAQYDYEGQQSDELSIQPGDVIYVTEKIDDDWWQGNLNGTIGIFPANYVDVLENY